MRYNSHTVAQSGVAALGEFTGRPATDIPGRVGIRVGGVSTPHATECRLVGSVPLVNVAALGTLPAGVAGIDGYQRDTRQFGLVRQEETQLRERPRVQNLPS